MIKVQIGSSELPIEKADAHWISEQINRRRREGQQICVRVSILLAPEVNILLSTPNCPRGGGISRPLREKEQRMFDLWDKRGLNEPEIQPGSLIAFLSQLEKLLG